jgi:hypothetical protein
VASCRVATDIWTRRFSVSTTAGESRGEDNAAIGLGVRERGEVVSFVLLIFLFPAPSLLPTATTTTLPL